MGGKSSSSTSSTTHTTNQDNRTAGGEIGSVTLGAGAEYINNFGPDVKDIAEQLIALAASGLKTAEGVSVLAQETVAQRADRSEKGVLTVLTDTFPVISAVAVIGALAWAAVNIFKGK